MRRIGRSVHAGVLLISLALMPALLPAFVTSHWAGAACASAAGAKHAVLVVETGSQKLKLCVGLDAPSVTGIHLIELAHSQDGLQYRLGFGGLAVCQLAGIGPTGGDCFAEYPSYWGFWLGDGSGGWTWSGSGAGSVQIHDGDLEGWTWGTGDTGTTHPRPPATTFASVCVASSPTATHPPPPSATPSSHHLTAPPTQAANPVPASASRTGGVRAPRSLEPGSPAGAGPSTIGTAEAAAAAAGDAGAGGGPPAGALLAIAGVVALGGAGWLRVRAGSRALSSRRREGR